MLTNEEKRVPIYSTTETPTVASTVSADTPLEDLNLNWRERDLPERERTKHVHRLHPYLGKFIPQLVEIFLRKYFRSGQTVLDPFAGSGTTLIQANELGINSIGYDISAFNVLLIRAKSAKYEPDKVRHEALDILHRTQSSASVELSQTTLWPPEQALPIAETDSAYLRDWFAPEALAQLLTYRHLIEAGGYEYADLLKVILSRSARSARLTTHFELDFPKRPQTEPYWCYKHRRTCVPTSDALKFLNRYTLDTIKRVTEFARIRTTADVTIHHGDSRQAAVPPVHGVVTSPPYVGLIDYHDQHRYAYHLLGLEDKSASEIGPAANGSSLRAKVQYQQDIAQVFRNVMENSMPSGGRMIVVAGDRANLYEGIAQLVGVEVEDIVQRHVNRRTGMRSNEFYESVFIWRKP